MELLDQALIGQEAIAFQANGTAYKQLISLFQEGIDECKNIAYPEDAKTDKEKIKYKENYMRKWATKTLGPALIKYCHDYFKLPVNSIEISGGYGRMFNGQDIASLTWPLKLSTKEIRNLTDLVKGVNDTKKADKSTVEFVENAFKLLDRDKAEFKFSMSELLGKPMPIFCAVFYINTNLIFCADDFVHTDNFTAEELAAIFLHEIGHVFAYIENYVHLCLVNDDFHTPPKININSKADIIKSCKDLKDALNLALKKAKGELLENSNSIESVKGVVALSKFGIDILDKFESITVSKIEHVDESSSLWSVIKGLMALILKVLHGILTTMILYPLLDFMQSEVENNAYIKDTTPGFKKGDIRGTRGTLKFNERRADEFATRMGSGAELARGLARLNAIYDKFIATYRSEAMLAVRHDPRFYNVLDVYIAALKIFSPMYYWETDLYERDYERIKRILQKMYSAFRAPEMENIPLNIRMHYEHETAELEKTIKEVKEFTDSDLAKLIGSIFRYLNPSTWAEMIKTGRIDERYRELQDNLDAMRDNPFFYYASKFTH